MLCLITERKFTQVCSITIIFGTHEQMLNTTRNIVLLMAPCIGGQKRSRRSLPSIVCCFSTALRFGPTVLVDCIDNQLDGAQEEAYSIWDLQK
jgi:hypothetical protein